MREDVGTADEGEDKAVDRAPEVGRMTDIVDVAPGHIPAVEQVERGEDVARDRYGDEKDVYAHPGFEEDRCEQDGRHRARSPYRIVIDIIPELEEVTGGGHDQRRDIENYVKDKAQRAAERHRKILLHHLPEEVQGEHIEKQMAPTPVYQAVSEHTVPLPAVPDIIGIELQRVEIQPPVEAQDADCGSDQYDEECDQAMRAAP